MNEEGTVFKFCQACCKTVKTRASLREMTAFCATCIESANEFHQANIREFKPSGPTGPCHAQKMKPVVCVNCRATFLVPDNSVQTVCLDCQEDARNALPKESHVTARCLNCGMPFSVPIGSVQSICEKCHTEAGKFPTPKNEHEGANEYAGQVTTKPLRKCFLCGESSEIGMTYFSYDDRTFCAPCHDRRVCALCQFYHAPRGDIGRCRRYPEQKTVSTDYWCGEYEK
jgi:hypothetical protein